MSVYTGKECDHRNDADGKAQVFLDRRHPLLCPSVLSCDLSAIAASVEALGDHADMIHCDVMDGRFVPNLTFGAPVVRCLSKHTDKPLDVHLMVQSPDSGMLKDFVRAGASTLVVHAEAVSHLQRTLASIREAGCFAGAALNPATPLEAVRWVLPDLDMLLLMTVNPGFGGQSFIPQMMDKIREARRMIADSGLPVRLQVDGGINASNAADMVRAGADMIVAGSAVFGADDPAEAAKALRSAIRYADCRL